MLVCWLSPYFSSRNTVRLTFLVKVELHQCNRLQQSLFADLGEYYCLCEKKVLLSLLWLQKELHRVVSLDVSLCWG